MSAGARRGEELRAHGTEPALLFAAALRLMGARMDERDAKLRAHQGEVLRAVVRAVVDVQAHGATASLERLLEDGQKCLGALCQGESGVGDDAGSIIEEGDQVGLAPLAPLADGHRRSVHHIAHPQFPGPGEGKAAAVVAFLGSTLAHQPRAAEQAVHGGARQRLGWRRDAALEGQADELRDGELGHLLLELEQAIGNRRRQRPRVPAVGARFGQQRVKAAASIAFEPVAQRLGGHPGAGAARNAVGRLRLVLQSRVQPRGVRRQMDELRDQAVAKQRHGPRIGFAHEEPLLYG